MSLLLISCVPPTTNLSWAKNRSEKRVSAERGSRATMSLKVQFRVVCARRTETSFSRSRSDHHSEGSRCPASCLQSWYPTFAFGAVQGLSYGIVRPNDHVLMKVMHIARNSTGLRYWKRSSRGSRLCWTSSPKLNVYFIRQSFQNLRF